MAFKSRYRYHARCIQVRSSRIRRPPTFHVALYFEESNVTTYRGHFSYEWQAASAHVARVIYLANNYRYSFPALIINSRLVAHCSVLSPRKRCQTIERESVGGRIIGGIGKLESVSSSGDFDAWLTTTRAKQ